MGELGKGKMGRFFHFDMAYEVGSIHTDAVGSLGCCAWGLVGGIPLSVHLSSRRLVFLSC